LILGEVEETIYVVDEDDEDEEPKVTPGLHASDVICFADQHAD
jgi:hypothetical protein